MTTGLSSESANWILPSHPSTFTSTIPNYEEAPPFRVNREGVKNYMKNRGSLNIGDWAIEGRRMSTTTTNALPNDQESILLQPKVLGPDALRNYTKSRSSTPNLIYGDLQPPNSHQGMRVKREGRANYEKSHHSQTKTLFENYGKLPLPTPKGPHTQGELATNLFYDHQEGQMGPILNNYGRSASTPRPNPHVKGLAAESNLLKGKGDCHLLEHGYDRYVPTPEPHLKGTQAHMNYEMGQGQHVNELFHQYGKLQRSARTAPKVKYGGVDNLLKGQGDAMKKTLSQCPPTHRRVERPLTATLWS
ncbi:hypothetical protein I4U23_014831 [Adineta vaga]|nr:hypothetical protein I4U23_014831 [Adineta vaga]